MIIEAPAEFRKSAFALLVGISQFEDQAFCERPLPCAENDVDDFKQLLCKGLGWDDQKCLVLHGTVSKAKLIKAFNSQIAAARAVGDAPLFLFYISTHGQFFDVQDQPQAGVLLTSDTDVANLPTAMATGISNQFLSGFMRETRSRQKLIISDACFAGAAASAQSLTPLSYYNALDAAVLASSRWESFAEPRGRNSLFTECLIGALQQTRGAVALPTFFEAVWSTVRERAALLGKDQEPILSHQGGPIVLGYLGPTTAPTKAFSFAEIHQSCTAILENQLARGSQDALAAEARYVARQQTEGNFWDFVAKPDGASAFTIVGSSGAGKSTTMAHLSLHAARQGHLVLWFGEDIGAVTDPLLLISRFFERLAPGLTPKDALASLPKGRELLVFFDAINEWPVSMATAKDFLGRCLDIASANSLQLVISCRENSWPEINELFTTQNTFVERKAESTSKGIVSSRLAAFSEEELQRALEVYKGIERFAIGNIARQPLFIRVVSQLAEASEVNFENLSLLEVLDEYLQIRVEKIARRIMKRPTEVSRGIDHIIRTLADLDSESLTRTVFFSELPEPLAVALLDEGLFKYSGEEITVEADIVHEHLLSRVLPSDMFASEDRFVLSVTGRSRLAPGAALLRLSGIKNSDLVLKALEWIDENNPLDILDALERLPLLRPYWSFFGRWFAQNPDYDSLIADTLQRRVDLETEFCLDAARAMFVNEHYYEWETKRWRDVSYRDFRERVESMRGAPELLAQCATHRPALVVSVLLNNWLPDRTWLAGGSGVASISHVAQTYLGMFGQRFPEIVFTALARLLRDQPSLGGPVDAILNQLAHTVPSETARLSGAWTKDFPGYVLTVVAELPEDFSAPAIVLTKEVIRHHNGNANLVESIIAAAARFPTREALDLVVRMKDRGELVNGLIIAIARLHGAFPEECEAIARELCWRPRPDSITLSYSCSFYAAASARSPDVAVQFFRRAAASDLPETARSISYQMIKLGKSGNTKFHALIEERLRIEKDPVSLFNYAIALAQYRKLRVDDFDWLRRWIAFPSFRETDHILAQLVASDISFREIADIVFLMEKNWASLEYAKQSSRLQDLAQDIIKDRRFGSLREYSKRVWLLVAQGEDPREASHTVLSELLPDEGSG
jgi:hypothetical protein